MIYVCSSFEMERAKLLRVLALKAMQDSKPCPACGGFTQRPQPKPIDYAWRVCGTCKGLAFDLSVLPDGGEQFDYFGMVGGESPPDLWDFYADEQREAEERISWMRILVEQGDVFDGTAAEWRNTFFDCPTRESIEDFCARKGWTVDFEENSGQLRAALATDGGSGESDG